jgi:hypothetical protein
MVVKSEGLDIAQPQKPQHGMLVASQQRKSNNRKL